MALLVPNALSIRTTEGFKVSFGFPTPLGASVRPASLKTQRFRSVPAVPVCVAAEPGVLLPAAVFAQPTVRGELALRTPSPKKMHVVKTKLLDTDTDFSIS